VRVVDLEAPSAPIDLIQPGTGSAYRSALIIARRHGRPCAYLTVPVGDEGLLTAAAVEALLAPLRLRLTGEAPPPPTTTRSPTITVVIVTCANSDRVVRCVTSILACSYGEFDVVVVENAPAISCTDAALREAFGAERRLRYIEEPLRGTSRARNAGLAVATGEAVAFVDDDVVVDPGWLRAVGAGFGSGVGCVTGLIAPFSLDTPGQTLFEVFAGFNKGFEYEVFDMHARDKADRLWPYAPGSIGSGGNMALLTALARRLGGFDIALGGGTIALGGEDLDLLLRVLLDGEQIVYDPAAMVFHEHPKDQPGLRRRAYSYGIGLSAMLTKQLRAGPRLPLLRAIPAGIRLTFNPASRKNLQRGDEFPSGLALLERVAMLAGPFAYVLSVARNRVRGGRPG
jgi:GT2 family glycosyltransferase